MKVTRSGVDLFFDIKAVLFPSSSWQGRNLYPKIYNETIAVISNDFDIQLSVNYHNI